MQPHEVVIDALLHRAQYCLQDSVGAIEDARILIEVATRILVTPQEVCYRLAGPNPCYAIDREAVA